MSKLTSVKNTLDDGDFIVIDNTKINIKAIGRVKIFPNGTKKIVWGFGIASNDLTDMKYDPSISVWINLGNISEQEELAFRMKHSI